MTIVAAHAAPLALCRLLIAVVILLGGGLSALSATEHPDPYRSWQQGRPGESLPLLWQQAEHSRDWALWYDTALAALAAEDHVSATRALLSAHRAAPWREEARQLLAQRDLAEPPPLYQDILGPWSILSRGWWGLILAFLISVSIWVLLITRYRRPSAVVAVLAAMLLLPPLTLRSLDQGQQWWVLAEDSVLIDASGQPLTELSAGAVLMPISEDAPRQRLRVADAQGRQGFIAQSQLLPVR